MFDSRETNGQRFQKSILIILFLFLTFALILTWTVPATGFESSIYISTPFVLWIALIFSELIGISIVIMSFSKSDLGESNLWKYGFFLIILCFTIILGLFIIRGYYMWCMIGDPASHLGWTNEIIQSGHLPSVLFYPATHIFLSEISLVTTFNLVFLHKIIPFFFGLICVVFMYMFVSELSPNKIMPVVAGIISCPLVFSMYMNLTPNGLSSMIFPLVLFVMLKYFKGYNKSWGILFCIMLILYPVFHPLPSIILGLILLTLWIPHTVHDLWTAINGKNRNLLNLIKTNLNKNVKVVIPFLILSIWFILWYSSFSLWGSTIIDIYQTISSEGQGSSNMGVLTSQIIYAQGYGYNVVEIFLKQYGTPVLLVLFSVLSFFFLWKTVSKEQKVTDIFSLYGPWGLICFSIPILYLFNLPFGPLRFLVYTSILGTVFLAYLVSYILIKSRKSEKRYLSGLTNLIIVVILFGLFLSATLNLYSSPYNLTLNYQTTKSDISGMTHFFEYRDVSIPVTGISINTRRFADLLLIPEKKSLQKIPFFQDIPPWHFGYDQFPSIASSYEKETDLIITKGDMVIYTDYFPDMAKIRFTQEDFKRLKNDPGANLVYSNGEFDILPILPNG